MATHPVVLGVLDRVLVNYQLSAPAAISIGPGEVAQPLHPDDAIYPMPRPHQELVVNVMWPLRGIHRGQRRHPDRGGEPPLDRRAARRLPPPRRWWRCRPAPRCSTSGACGTAAGPTTPTGPGWASSSTTRRRGSDPSRTTCWRCRPTWPGPCRRAWLELLGYNIYPPFIGYVDGRHPRKLLTPSGADAP